MKKAAIKNIKDTFEANPNVETFYANEAGHCFNTNYDGLTMVNRKDLGSLKAEDAGADSEENADSGEKTPEAMTVAELKAKLTDLGVEFPGNANKTALVALLTDALKPE